ncbi:zinc ribbon domain-containing protein [Bacillus thuringiensis]|uniref:zinc ribbon domain-containing protein n=1 Tax=Bacillus thuringiensis TaxID=1428 RepID=UPI001CD682E7|nr:zinc ribbon domain-containing protein [Bacillus thuringiensis]MCA1002745.1 zinc ribbon domain-containing protein [Bacillus thuringiensis]
MKYCTQCGKENDTNSNFCGYCGEEFNHKKVSKHNLNNSNSDFKAFSLIGFINRLVSGVINLLGIDGTNGAKNIITRKRLFLAIIFFIVCSILVYNFGVNTTERKEAKYLNSIFEEISKADDLLKQTAHQDGTDDALKHTAKELNDINDDIKKLVPPETLPVEVIDSQKTLESGIEKVIDGVRYADVVELEKGQTTVTLAKILFEGYVQKQSDVKKLIDDKYIENFILNENDKSNNVHKTDKSQKIIIDKNCYEVYGEQECKKFKEYYEQGDGQQEF